MLEEAQLLHSERFKREFNRSGYRNGAGFSGKGMLPQPSDDKMKTEDKPPWSDQIKSLKAQRRARGECFKCGDKFQPGHRCAKNVPLNVVEELWEQLQLRSNSEGEHESASSEEEVLTKISYCAATGTAAKKTIRLQATIRGKQVLVLVDSRSSGSFISQQAVDRLKLPVQQFQRYTWW